MSEHESGRAAPPAIDVPAIGEIIDYTTKTIVLRCEARRGRVLRVWRTVWDGPIIETDSGRCVVSLGDTWTRI